MDAQTVTNEMMELAMKVETWLQQRGNRAIRYPRVFPKKVYREPYVIGRTQTREAARRLRQAARARAKRYARAKAARFAEIYSAGPSTMGALLAR